MSSNVSVIRFVYMKTEYKISHWYYMDGQSLTIDSCCISCSLLCLQTISPYDLVSLLMNCFNVPCKDVTQESREVLHRLKGFTHSLDKGVLGTGMSFPATARGQLRV